MTPDEKLDAMSALAAMACTTETGYRLHNAIVTDGLVSRVLRDTVDDTSEMRNIARTMTREAIIDVAKREMDELDSAEMTAMQEAVIEHFKERIAAAARHAWTVADMLGYPPARLDPEVVAFVAAVYTIPFDASTADS
jgi:hypothetical protein